MSTTAADRRATKTCRVCGREMQWRKAWARTWDEVTTCSAACRRRGVRPVDRALEEAVVAMLRSRPAASTLCPGEVARRVDPEGWRRLMEPTRRAARRLTADGVVEIRQRGRRVDPSTARGAIRVARGPAFDGVRAEPGGR